MDSMRQKFGLELTTDVPFMNTTAFSRRQDT